jgi:carboxypeptidase PM20D1
MHYFDETTITMIPERNFSPKTIFLKLLKAGVVVMVFSILFPAFLNGQKYDPAGLITGEEASRLLSEYIKHPSVSGNEKNAGEYFAGICREKGLTIKILSDYSARYNFTASLYPLDLNKPNIVFLNHIDVVNEGDTSVWIHPPFSGAIINDTVWGRGAIDMKGVAIMQLLATSSLSAMARQNDLPVNVTLLCVSGEENYGVNGAEYVCDTWYNTLNPAVVIGEGGIGSKNMLTRFPEKLVFAISLSDKRAVWIKLHLNYKASGHGAIPPPEYACKMMIKALSSLTQTNPSIHFNDVTTNMLKSYGKMEKGLKGFLIQYPRFFKPIIAGGLRKNPIILSTLTNTITLTHIENGVKCINQIPQEISAYLDCRLLPETSTDDFLEYLRKIIGNNNIGINVIKESKNAPPTKPDICYTLFGKSLAETYPGAGLFPVLFPATTDNNYFRAKGVPVYGFIPAVLNEDQMQTVHNYNERIAVNSLVLGAKTYSRFLEMILMQDDFLK